MGFRAQTKHKFGWSTSAPPLPRVLSVTLRIANHTAQVSRFFITLPVHLLHASQLAVFAEIQNPIWAC